MRIRPLDILLLTGLLLSASALRAMQNEAKFTVGAGKTHLMDMPVDIERIAVASPETADAVPVNPRTVMVNGKAPGETSLVIWLADGSRREYEVTVAVSAMHRDVAVRQIENEFGGDVHLAVDNTSVYLTGRVKNLYAAQRAESIGATLGKVVDLLKVDVPDQETQILLKVRFANVDRSKSLSLGLNLLDAQHGFPITATTGQFGASQITGVGTSGPATYSLSDALNLFLFDSKLNIGATIEDLQTRSVLQILAEPNILALNGHEASFVSGGEFPFPTLQGGGSGVGQITIQFREFGVRIHFLPRITPRGTIRLHVTPEVSSLDYADALTVSGFTIPALTTRRVDTEVELEDGQSFAIAGLLDNTTTESLSRIPGLADIPLLGKLFTSKSISRANSELLVIITPQLIGPIPAGETLPDLQRPTSFLAGPDIMTHAPRQEQSGPASVKPRRGELPVQEMQRFERELTAVPAPAAATPPPAAGSGVTVP